MSGRWLPAQARVCTRSSTYEVATFWRRAHSWSSRSVEKQPLCSLSACENHPTSILCRPPVAAFDCRLLDAGRRATDSVWGRRNVVDSSAQPVVDDARLHAPAEWGRTERVGNRDAAPVDAAGELAGGLGRVV